MISKKKTLATLACALLLPALSFAQGTAGPDDTTTLPPSLIASSTPANTPGIVNCFDYYHFGSVQVDVSPNLSSTVSGAPIHFAGLIKNDNDYPIVDGQVYAKVFYKNQKDDSLAHQNGYPLVDQFLVQDNVVLNARQNKPIEFDWQVPGYAESGDYEVALYFTSAHRFNLLGLSFTDDVTGNKADFRVESEATTNIAHFDKNTVMLNDTLFRFAAFPPHFGKDEAVTVHPTLVNPSKGTVSIEVSYDLYAWDAMRPENLESSHKETVTLKPGESQELSYTVPAINASVSYLAITATDKDTKSILDVRFVRDGIDETRINFPSLSAWPLKAGVENTVFSCIHSTNSPVVSDNTLTLTLKDLSGTVLHTYTYSGDITGEMMGVKDSFTPSKDSASVTLTATLKHGGTLVDEVTQTYDCKAIDPTLCPKGMSLSLPTILTILAILIILGGGAVLWRKKTAEETAPPPLYP